MPAPRRATHGLLPSFVASFVVWAVVSAVSVGFAALPSALLAQASTAANPEYLPDEPSDRDQQARSLFEQGRQAYEAGRYRDAWGYFHDSYKLSGRPQLLYNIGQTADRLGMDADALRAFKMYLERLPDAANAREVDNRVRALEDRVKASGAVPAPPLDATDSGAAPTPTETKTNDGLAPPVGGQPKRQNWYFRGGLGLGFRHDGVSGSGVDSTVSGAGASGELAAGLTLMPGLAIGGGVFFDWTSKPTQKDKGMAAQDLDSANLTMIGPMGDWYLHPETDGLHFQAALTLAVLNVSRGTVTTTSSPIGTKTGTGAGLVAGGGYEWAVQDNWAVGVLGRITLAGVSEDSHNHGFFAISVLGTATWW